MIETAIETVTRSEAAVTLGMIAVLFLVLLCLAGGVASIILGIMESRYRQRRQATYRLPMAERRPVTSDTMVDIRENMAKLHAAVDQLAELAKSCKVDAPKGRQR